MKILLSLICLLALAPSAQARSQRNPVDTSDFAVEICTHSTINIYSNAATNLQNDTQVVALASATVIGIYNVDTSTAIVGGYESNVSISTNSISYGREIGAKTEYVLSINLDKIPYFVKASAGVVKATVTKCR